MTYSQVLMPHGRKCNYVIMTSSEICWQCTNTDRKQLKSNNNDLAYMGDNNNEYDV